jgi:hypothetical protein
VRKACVQMKHMKHLFVLLFAFCAVSATAQVVPSGHFSYSFTNPPLWDVTGTYSLNGTSNGVTDNATFVITNAASGQITGTQTETLSDGSITLNVSSAVSGKLSVKAGAVAASLKSTGTFSGTFSGTAKGKSTETIVSSNLTIAANVSEALIIPGHGSRKFSATATASLPGGMDGDWSLDTDITTNGTKLAGTGTLTLSNDRTLTYLISGTYNTQTEVAKLKLTGQGAALKTSFSLSTQGTNMVLTAIKGKVLGQKPTLTVPVP